MRVLITGFEPFGGESINPSWLMANSYENQQTSGCQIFTACLPTAFGESLQRLQELIALHQPQWVIALGQAGGRSVISLERVAINIDDAHIPDNSGAQPIDRPIVAGGSPAYFSSLPIKAIVHNLRQAGIPADVSNTAGTYVCNHVFYGLMHLSRNHPGMKAGFVHIPYLPEQAAQLKGPPSMALADMLHALQIIVQTCLQTDTDLRMQAGTEC